MLSTDDSHSTAEYTDKTFRGYSTSQAKEYARARGGYPQRLINEVIAQHARTGGQFGNLLDLGCGPGNATRDLACHFETATGTDPSSEMIRTAQEFGGNAGSEPIYFLQGEAESCAGIPDHSVDLIIAATSGHWFDMERFWPTAARVLKPGGTVALFTIWRIHCHPQKTPHADEIQRILIELEQETLGPFQTKSNWNLMGLYKDLVMPWSISEPCSAFAKSGYRRQVWNEDGVAESDGSYICGQRRQTLDEAENTISTISAVTRWREAYPDLALTEQDCVRAAFARIRKILGTDGSGEITMVGPSVIVSVKKRT